MLRSRKGETSDETKSCYAYFLLMPVFAFYFVFYVLWHLCIAYPSCFGSFLAQFMEPRPGRFLNPRSTTLGKETMKPTLPAELVPNSASPQSPDYSTLFRTGGTESRCCDRHFSRSHAQPLARTPHSPEIRRNAKIRLCKFVELKRPIPRIAQYRLARS